MKVQGFLRSLKHTPDRLLHPLRRRRAIRQVRGCKSLRRVLFLCHGNICRSPYAEKALGAALPESLKGAISVSSAGLLGPGRPSPPEARRVAEHHGVNLGGHLSRLVSREALRTADLVVVMNRGQRSAIGRHGVKALLLGDFDPDFVDTRAVRDPVDQSDQVFDEVYDRIDRCLSLLVPTLVNR